MTENEFLISRAIAVFNIHYGDDIDPGDCAIQQIPPDKMAVRGYEITTPTKSPYFRLRYYITFDKTDSFVTPRLETIAPNHPGQLGDEVYVIRGLMDEYWKTQGGYAFKPLPSVPLPFGTILTEGGVPIMTEGGSFMVIETAAS